MSKRSKNFVTLHVTHKIAPEKIKLCYFADEIMDLIAKDILMQEQENDVKISNAKMARSFCAAFEIFSSRRKRRPLSLKSCQVRFSEIMKKIKGNL